MHVLVEVEVREGGIRDGAASRCDLDQPRASEINDEQHVPARIPIGEIDEKLRPKSLHPLRPIDRAAYRAKREIRAKDGELRRAIAHLIGRRGG